MRTHRLQHVPFEGLDYIADWAADNPCPVTGTRLFDAQPVPDVGDFDP